MKDLFKQEFPSYKERIDSFTTSTNFYSKLKEYEDLLSTISTVKTNIIQNQDRPPIELINAIDESYILMNKIVELNKELETIFKMNEERLGMFCNYDFKKIDKRVTQDLMSSANLVKKFDGVSQKSREIFESLDNTFTSQST